MRLTIITGLFACAIAVVFYIFSLGIILYGKQDNFLILLVIVFLIPTLIISKYLWWVFQVSKKSAFDRKFDESLLDSPLDKNQLPTELKKFRVTKFWTVISSIANFGIVILFLTEFDFGSIIFSIPLFTSACIALYLLVYFQIEPS